jgi:hypothetical protein
LNVKRRQHLVEHLAVLARDANNRINREA